MAKNNENKKVIYTPARANLYINEVEIKKSFELTEELKKNAVFMKTFEHAIKIKLIEVN
ncbi:MAG: hypothetical protein LBG21_02895 [Campylobacteraceae bacterium]|jgi:hypothetical protein|nr:hypothetical protein [Campylobacteraceae bacterium]